MLGKFCIDIYFFSDIGKININYFPQLVSWVAAFKERRELNLEKQRKLPEIVNTYNLLWRNPYVFFSLNSKSNYNFSNQFIGGRVRRFRFLRFGFAHGSSGSRILRFIGYLIFYGSVPRFRFDSKTLLIFIYNYFFMGKFHFILYIN